MVYTGIADSAQRASVNLSYTPVPGTTTGEVQATWDYVSQYTPVEPTYPGGGVVIAGSAVPGPSSTTRFKISVPAYANYTYEVYGNPTLGTLSWSALPFSVSQTGAIDRNKHTATADGNLDIYLQEKATRGFYYVSFRVTGANTGTP